MTEEDIKEALSVRCIEALANSLGFTVESSKSDYGIDLTIHEIVSRTEPNGKTSYCNSNRDIKAQLKATTPNSIRISNGVIKYDLRVKNYNDIASSVANLRPIYLFLIVLPVDRTRWVEYTKDELILRSECYWYIHPKGTPLSGNSSTNVIDIPETQLIETNTFKEILDEIYK